MTTPRSQSPQSDKQEISRLVAAASEESRGDVYAGKRQLPRYSTGMPLEAVLDKSRTSEAFPVTMHNVSDTGLAFWAKREIEPGEDVFLREFSDDDNSAWVGAEVTHCTAGIRGFLIGAQFHHPLEPEERAPEPADLVAVGHEANAPTAAPDGPSKRKGLLDWLGFGRNNDHD
jgi:hypothetical protein